MCVWGGGGGRGSLASSHSWPLTLYNITLAKYVIGSSDYLQLFKLCYDLLG